MRSGASRGSILVPILFTQMISHKQIVTVVTFADSNILLALEYIDEATMKLQQVSDWIYIRSTFGK